MKKVLLLAFIAFAMNANAQENNEVDQIDETTVVKYENEEDDDNWSTHLFIGVITPTDINDKNDNGLDFATFRSWEIGLTVAQYDYIPNNSKTTLSAGLGFGFRFNTLSGHDNMFEKINDKICVQARDGVMSELSSNISTFYISMPLLVKQSFAKNFAISLGAQANWNAYSRVSNSYEIGDQEYTVLTKKIGQRPLTVDVLGIVHFAKDFGVYFKYSPMSLLKKDRGPEFKSFTVGIYL
ncbi:MAG: hypothetical protein IKX25_04720 [Bacteroidales bacterium]|nr:hypothetical protein [Bacteroidales bacterium]